MLLSLQLVTFNEIWVGNCNLVTWTDLFGSDDKQTTSWAKDESGIWRAAVVDSVQVAIDVIQAIGREHIVGVVDLSRLRLLARHHLAFALMGSLHEQGFLLVRQPCELSLDPVESECVGCFTSAEEGILHKDVVAFDDGSGGKQAEA